MGPHGLETSAVVHWNREFWQFPDALRHDPQVEAYVEQLGDAGHDVAHFRRWQSMDPRLDIGPVAEFLERHRPRLYREYEVERLQGLKADPHVIQRASDPRRKDALCHARNHVARKAIRRRVDDQYRTRIEADALRFLRFHGGSSSHGCMDCFYNRPCHACGSKRPLDEYLADPVKHLGNWRGSWRCVKPVLADSLGGVHICNACAMKHLLYRRVQIARARKRRARGRPSCAFPVLTLNEGPQEGTQLRLEALDPLTMLPLSETTNPIDDVHLRYSRKRPGEEVWHVVHTQTNYRNGCTLANRKRLLVERGHAAVQRRRQHSQEAEWRREEATHLAKRATQGQCQCQSNGSTSWESTSQKGRGRGLMSIEPATVSLDAALRDLERAERKDARNVARKRKKVVRCR